ncbi:hypothetical protein D4R86_05050 [bacterium]|nr:MAG: hypothetical protein D4R86_05050 [bacterium]
MKSIENESRFMPEEETKRPDIQRVAKVIENLVATKNSPDESPNRSSDIHVRSSVLEKMGVDESWYTEEELAKGENSWFSLLLNAERMADPQDSEFGRYKKTREKSKITTVLANFKNMIRLDAPKNETDQSLEELSLVISVFRKKGTLSDLGGAMMKNIFK